MKKFRFMILSVLIICTSFVTAQIHGNATYYSNKLKGRHTTDGSRYHPDSMTCAHKTYPFGTILKVRNPKNDKEVIVKVTDRGPFQKRLMIDLSYKAASELDIVRFGIAAVEITKLDFIPFLIPNLIPKLIQAPIALLVVSQNYPDLTSLHPHF